MQNLDHAADFVVTADHRIELASACALGQVHGVFFQRFTAAFRFRITHRFAAAHGIDGLFDVGAVAAMLLQQPAGFALVLGQCQQEQFGGDVLIAAFLRFLVGEVQQIAEIAGNRHLAGGAFDFGQALYCGFESTAQRCDVDTCALQQRSRAAILLCEQGLQQMLRLNIGMIAADRCALRVSEGLLELGGEFVETHVHPIAGEYGYSRDGAHRGGFQCAAGEYCRRL